MARLLGRYVPNSTEWHELRRWRIGGSEIGAVCGLSPWQTPDQLMAAKLTKARQPVSNAMLRGTLLEPGVAAWAEAKYGLTIDHDLDGTYVHDDHDYALYNPDGITGDGLLLECKTTSNRCAEQGWGRAGTDQVPLTYAAQVQWGLGVLGLDRAVLVVLAGAHEGRPNLAFARYIIRRDPDLFAALLDQAAAFITRLDSARKDHAA